MAEKATESPGATHAGFDETHWTIVLAAAGRESQAGEALENLCRRYRPPLYAFIRAQGISPPDAEDLVQKFLVHLLSKDRLSQVDPVKGKFRSFLLACLTNFLRNEWDKAKTQRRGGGYEHHTIKASDTATGDGVSLVEMDDPSRQFEREWAATLVRGVLGQLKSTYVDCGKTEFFETLHPLLAGEAVHGQSVKAAAEKLGMEESAIRQATKRMRERYRTLLLAEVGRTVETPAQALDELRDLLGAFQRR